MLSSDLQFVPSLLTKVNSQLWLEVEDLLLRFVLCQSEAVLEFLLIEYVVVSRYLPTEVNETFQLGATNCVLINRLTSLVLRLAHLDYLWWHDFLTFSTCTTFLLILPAFLPLD